MVCIILHFEGINMRVVGPLPEKEAAERWLEKNGFVFDRGMYLGGRNHETVADVIPLETFSCET